MTDEIIHKIFTQFYSSGNVKQLYRISQVLKEHKVINGVLPPQYIIQYDSKEIVIYDVLKGDIAYVLSAHSLDKIPMTEVLPKDKVFLNKLIPGHLLSILLPSYFYKYYNVRTLSLVIGRVMNLSSDGRLFPYACMTNYYIKPIQEVEMSSRLSHILDKIQFNELELHIADANHIITFNKIIELISRDRYKPNNIELKLIVSPKVLIDTCKNLLDTLKKIVTKINSIRQLSIITYVDAEDDQDKDILPPLVRCLTYLKKSLRLIKTFLYMYEDATHSCDKLSIELYNSANRFINSISLLPFIRLNKILDNETLNKFFNRSFDPNISVSKFSLFSLPHLLVANVSPCLLGRLTIIYENATRIYISPCILYSASGIVYEFNRKGLIKTLLLQQNQGLCEACPYALVCNICRCIIMITRIKECPIRNKFRR